MSALEGKRIAITGAGRGIGRAYAIAMAREGARVLVNDLPGSGAEASPAAAVVAEITASGGEAVLDTHDVADPQAAHALVAESIAAFGGLDVLVNNAAIEFRGSVEAHAPEDWDRVMAVNARGSFNCARAVIPVFRDQADGLILNTTSGAFWEGTDGVVAYAASKAAVFSLTLTLHTELAGEGIRSNCISPNATRTRMLDTWVEQLSAQGEQAAEATLAEYGVQSPENLAPLAIVLCSDAAREISGRVFEVWGDRIHEIGRPTRGPGLARAGGHWEIDDLAKRLPGLGE